MPQPMPVALDERSCSVVDKLAKGSGISMCRSHTRKTHDVVVLANNFVICVEPGFDGLADGVDTGGISDALGLEDTEELAGSLALRGRSVDELVLPPHDVGPVLGVVLEAVVPGDEGLADIDAGLVDDDEGLDLVTGSDGDVKSLDLLTATSRDVKSLDVLATIAATLGSGSSVDHAEGGKAQDTSSDDLVGEHLEGLGGLNV